MDENLLRLVLVPLDGDMKDVAGHVYPEDGLVNAEGFDSSLDIRKGLSGILWGVADVLPFLPEKKWAVVRLDAYVKIVVLDPAWHMIKFPEGFVLKVGTLQEASQFIRIYCAEHGLKKFETYQLVGYEATADLPNKHAIATGYKSSATSEVGGLHAISTAQESRSLSVEFSSHAVSIGDDSEAVTLGESSHALTFEGGSISKAIGHKSAAIALNAHSKAFSTGRDSVSVCLDIGGVAGAGINSTLIMAYESGGRRKFAIGYTDEGLEPYRMYRCEDGQFILMKMEESPVSIS
jgi:hypothetical protein